VLRWIEPKNTTDDKSLLNVHVAHRVTLHISLFRDNSCILVFDTMRFHPLVLNLSWLLLLHRSIATAFEQHQAAEANKALRGPSRRLHDRRVATNVDERCRIPTTDKPNCVATKVALLQKIADNEVGVILICPGSIIDLTLKPSDDSILIDSNKTIICEGIADSGCIMTSQSLPGNGPRYFRVALADVHVSFCGIHFSKFRVSRQRRMWKSA
jgi:hypothetical protein